MPRFSYSCISEINHGLSVRIGQADVEPTSVRYVSRKAIFLAESVQA